MARKKTPVVENVEISELETLLTVEDLLHVHIRPRFPIAVMHWYGQYSNHEAAREGTIAYAISLTPGLTEEAAGAWIDKLVAEQAKPEPVVVKVVEKVETTPVETPVVEPWSEDLHG